jgi:hypothetical protein
VIASVEKKYNSMDRSRGKAQMDWRMVPWPDRSLVRERAVGDRFEIGRGGDLRRGRRLSTRVSAGEVVGEPGALEEEKKKANKR